MWLATESGSARCTPNTQHRHHGEEHQHHYSEMISALSKVWDVIREELRGAIGLWKQPCISDRYQLFAISFRDNQGKRPNLFFYSEPTSGDEWLVNKPDMQTTNAGFYDGRLSPSPVIDVGVNPSSPRRSKPTIVPWSCRGDSFGVSPSGCKKAIVMLMLIWSVGLGWSQDAFSCRCSGFSAGLWRHKWPDEARAEGGVLIKHLHFFSSAFVKCQNLSCAPVLHEKWSSRPLGGPPGGSLISVFHLSGWNIQYITRGNSSAPMCWS